MICAQTTGVPLERLLSHSRVRWWQRRWWDLVRCRTYLEWTIDRKCWRTAYGKLEKERYADCLQAQCIDSDAVQPWEVRGWLLDLAFGANFISTSKETRKKKCKPSFSASGHGYEGVAVATNLSEKQNWGRDSCLGGKSRKRGRTRFFMILLGHWINQFQGCPSFGLLITWDDNFL